MENAEGIGNLKGNGSAEEGERKKRKKGIVYLSSIPKYTNITKIRELLSAYGKIGRIYLQLTESESQRDGKRTKRKKHRAMSFSEGWVEFESKKVAKYVASTLNNKQISARKKSKFYDVVWNIKYLPGFKWIHLSERLAYERAVRKQRLQTEIAQAKREANFFSRNVDRSRKLRSKQADGNADGTFVPATIKQRDTDAEIRSRKENHAELDRTDFLQSLFKPSL